MDAGTVYICHAVDTEGPLNETLEGTFNRIYEQLGVRLQPTKGNLKKIREKSMPLDGKEDAAAELVRENMIDTYLSSWDQIDKMNETVMSSNWRASMPDSFGGPYVISWHCMDHVNFKNNPRGRAMGYHAVYEYYERMLDASDIERDQINFHFHPPSISGDAHRVSAGLNINMLHNEILARRIIDKKWFPTVFRPGSHTETFDINVWLEQWIPFDIANLNTGKIEDVINLHPVPGRFGDWRGSTTDWEIYNPDLYDYRKPGQMKRYISRVQNLNTRYANINEVELIKAFELASIGKSPLVCVTNHDFRDMKEEVEQFCQMVKKVGSKYVDVKFRWCNAVEGFRASLGFEYKTPPVPNASIIDNILNFNSNCEIWGNQPFLAIKTHDGRYIRDDFIIEKNNEWKYAFDVHSIALKSISQLGIAFNDKVGNVAILSSDCESNFGYWQRTILHEHDWFL